MVIRNIIQSAPYDPPVSIPVSPAPPPTLHEVLSSFSACNDRDRDMLIQLIVEKSQQDQLITRNQRAQYEQLVQSNLILRENLLDAKAACEANDRFVPFANVSVHQPTTEPVRSTFILKTTVQMDVPSISSSCASTSFFSSHLAQLLLDTPSSASPRAPLRDAAPQLFPVPSVNPEKPYVPRRLNWGNLISEPATTCAAQDTSLPRDNEAGEKRISSQAEQRFHFEMLTDCTDRLIA
ncbi:hypothetical protein [Phaffia rhodozyma]|uniref:Uncharacterized protein n=1 Tax=Phaffia rhodozyma TaxID=264483 RepID=A0A0F7SNG4_PHARH|nr:hypothetical protein [Phaffia rhodozyma]